MNNYTSLIKYIIFILCIYFLIFSLYSKNYKFLPSNLLLTLILIFDQLYTHSFVIQETTDESKSAPSLQVDACIFINNTLEYKTNFMKLIGEMKKKEPTRHYLYVENARNLSNLRYKLDQMIKPRLDNIKGNIIVFFYGYGYENYAFMGTEKITFQTFYNEILKYKNENANALILSNIFNNENGKITNERTDKIKFTNFLHINVTVKEKEKEHLLHLISTKKLFSTPQTDLEFYNHILKNMPNVSHYVSGRVFNIPSLI